MSIENILNKQDLLKSLASCKLCMRKAILHKADKKLIQAICESILNMLSGNLHINTTDFEKLKNETTNDYQIFLCGLDSTYNFT